ncbi:Xaa-Pro peptidase family protein [Terrarubrum flagellatum]|uniref:M24 family metallopeptidase n=1 Tax=Terrirubrum flagellatum TaxID=2895980 RepID=UPI0031450CF4
MAAAQGARQTRLRQKMIDARVDIIVAFKPENSFYLSGFNPIIYSHPVIALFPRDGSDALLVHALRDDHARASTHIRDVRLYGAWSTKVTMGPSWLAALKAMLEERGLATSTIGLELDFVSVARFAEIKEALPAAIFRDVSDLIMEARTIKDDIEIAHARAAAKIADIGMDAAIAELRRGGSERDISLAAMAAMDRYWADNFPDKEVSDFGSLEGGVQNGLCCWALAGERMFMNCDNPTNRKPAPGETVSILIWTVIEGIHGENERTVMVGDVAPEKERALQSILEIRGDVIAAIKPGARYCDLYEVTKRGLEARGYGKYLPGRIGHGIGLGAHEHPSIDAKTEIPLLPGMIITIEPNIRIPGEVATQISDTVLVTETGCESLTRSVGGLIRA